MPSLIQNRIACGYPTGLLSDALVGIVRTTPASSSVIVSRLDPAIGGVMNSVWRSVTTPAPSGSVTGLVYTPSKPITGPLAGVTLPAFVSGQTNFDKLRLFNDNPIIDLTTTHPTHPSNSNIPSEKVIGSSPDAVVVLMAGTNKGLHISNGVQTYFDLPASGDWCSVAYGTVGGRSRWIAISRNSRFSVQSLDGKVWFPRPLPLVIGQFGIIGFGSGTVLIVGSSGVLSGPSWDAISVKSARPIPATGVTFGGGKFLVASLAGVVAMSTSAQVLSVDYSTSLISGIVWTGKSYIACSASSNLIHVSATGTPGSWVTKMLP